LIPYNKIFELHKKLYSKSQIAREVDCSRTTVVYVLNTATKMGYEWDGSQTDCEVHRMFHPLERFGIVEAYYIELSAYISQMPGQSIAQIWKLYCHNNNITHYSRAAYYRLVKEKIKEAEPLKYNNGIAISFLKIENKLLIIAKTLFSGFVFFDFLKDVSTREWINYLNALLQKVGGRPKILFVYGRPPKHFTNETEKFCTYNHIILSCSKSTSPYNDITNILISLGFESSAEKLMSAVEELNYQRMPGCDFLTREQLFEYEIKQFVPLLPEYQMVEECYKYAGIDFHVNIKGALYSIPFSNRHDKFHIKIYDEIIEIYTNEKLLCSHLKSKICGQYITNPEHLPKDDEIPWNEVSGAKLRDGARKIGKNTFKIIHKLLKLEKFECYAFTNCRKILEVANMISPEEVEEICEYSISTNIIDAPKIITLIKEKNEVNKRV